MAEKVVIQLTLDKKDFNKSLQSLAKESEKAGKTSGAAFGKGFSSAARAINRSGIGRAFDSIQKRIFSIQGALTAAFGGLAIRRVIGEAVDLENSLIGLVSVAEAFGGSADRITNEAKRLAADGLIPLTDVTDSLKNLLANFDGDIDKSVKAFEVLRDAAAFNRQGQLELGEAIRGASQGLKNDLSIKVDNAGITKNLSVLQKEYAREIGKSVGRLNEAEKAQAEYVGLLREGSIFQGDYNKLLATFSGALSRVRGEFRFFIGELGQLVTRSPAVIALVQTIADQFSKLREEINNTDANKFSETARDIILASVSFGAAVEKAITFVKGLFNAVKIGLGTISLIGGLISKGITGVFLELPALILKGIRSLIATIIREIPLIPNSIADTIERSTEIEDSVLGLGQKINDGIKANLGFLESEIKQNKELFNGLFGDEAAQTSDSFANRFIANLERITAALGKVKKGLKDAGNEGTNTGSKLQQTGKNVANTFKNVLARSISQGVQDFTKAFILGEKGFGNLAKRFLGLLGELSTQIGQVLILAGIGIKSLFALEGGAALAAGVGLVALGTILKSFAGGGEETAGGGAAAFGEAQGAFIQDEPEEREGPSTEVVVNIQGDVLDSDETGQRIVDILNDAYDKQGVVINRGIIA